MNSLKLEITAAQAGQRLDRLLHAAEPDLSRTALQKAIQSGHCTVDGLTETRPAAKVRTGQQVHLQLPEVSGQLQPEDGHLELLWQDEHLVVCNKPAGLTVHPCPSCPEQTLVQRLLARFPQLGKIEGQRPGIVHRLDKDTSGLLVVALTETDRLSLSNAFADRQVHKEYLALVAGLAPKSGQCQEPVGRHPTAKVKMAIVPENRGGRHAHTEWQRLWHSENKAISLLAVRIHTGRTHQIRVHMAHLGYPLLGDKLYAPKAVRDMAPRQMLHAWRLSFTHPASGEALSFSCPPPDDMPEAALTTDRRMQRLVITGNPGSGKSAFSDFLAQKGVPVISADTIVTSLYAPSGAGSQWIGRLRGARLLEADGSVNRVALMAAMQEDPVLRRDVEQTVHALTRQAVETFWAQEEAQGTPLAAAEIPLYFECGWQQLFSPKPLTVGVHCPLPLRSARTARTRGWNQEKMAALEAWQWPEEQKMAACDLIITNDKYLRHLDDKVTRFLLQLRLHLEKAQQKQADTLTKLWL
ncbi:MAG: dephospho-CoA kinase [Desulfovibrio sp.]|nr:dephospho-CoA kinase [Desulfovibrio sp.]